MEKTRKERRKEARSKKKNELFMSWMTYQKRSRDDSPNLSSSMLDKRKANGGQRSFGDQYLHKRSKKEKDGDNTTGVGNVGSSRISSRKKRKNEKASDLKAPKTKFEEYLQLERRKGADVDVELEEELARKLNAKNGKLGGPDDGLNSLLGVLHGSFQGADSDEDLNTLASAGVEDPIPDNSSDNSDFDSDMHHNIGRDAVDEDEKNDASDMHAHSDMTDDEESNLPERETKISEHDDLLPEIVTIELDKNDVQKSTTADSPALLKRMKYVAPHLRPQNKTESEEQTQIFRQIRGLLNRLSESNVESITRDISVLIQSLGRNRGSEIVREEIMSTFSKGPRGNEQYAAVFAAFIAGMACLIGVDFGAKFLTSVAISFENDYLKNDGLAVRNLCLLLSQMCIFGVCSSDLVYDLLSLLLKRMTEMDVAAILTILQYCGMKLRSDDPAAMKDFVVSAQKSVNDLKSSEANSENKTSSKRMDFMLDAISDIKNNKRKQKDDSSHNTRLKKWLQKLRVEEIQIRGIKWSKLLDPHKKGQWWLSGDIETAEDTVSVIAERIDSEALDAQKLLRLASAGRMNTEARRGIFCVIMSGEDYLDAFEKLLRLELPGKQDREIMRVLVVCCLQEKVFNKYYSVLATKLCSHHKNHKFTLQYCLWDQFKQLESMEPRRSINLAYFISDLLVSFSISLAVLKVVDFSDPRYLTAKRIMHFRMLFDCLFKRPDAIVWNIFSRIAAGSDLQVLREGLEFFLKRYVVEMATTERATVSEKFKVAKKALHNVAGVLRDS